jgi:Tfp pilus assembly protein FimT
MDKPSYFCKGFAMVEVVLSISILTIIFAMTIPNYLSFMTRNDLDIATMSLVQSTRRAAVLSQTGSGDSLWGVNVATGSIIIYKGNDFANRDSSFDEVTDISPTIAVTGLTQIIFSKQTGLPQSTGTTTLVSVDNESRHVKINQKGMVDY